MKITLTFDNGPDPEVTPEVLSVLKARGLLATFFVLGDKLRDPARRAACERAHGEGHWIGNHTFNHLVPLGLSSQPDISTREIARTEALIGDLAHPDKLFRPFGGGGNLGDSLLDGPAFEFLQRERYTLVLWNAVPGDWAYPDTWVDRALDACRENDWTALVLHDLPTGAMAHLDAFIARAADEGATFVQDLPPDVVPMRRGEIVGPVRQYVNAAA
ncbi:polysaccharide deacetylase family protein [Acuticoccus sp. M5D2P5]|uniref:polysaccharide deacetylase family protein n=1 Tax=Acuticoccus kalidii TaxID=2910977 RepID=UPI001F2BE0AC|nr:polysaccharide deacetylase family protein [Acuticoccus kalidii]MCF3933174.1 polysaccharide deacetylase family protein [Acuticoccus kalidii]